MKKINELKMGIPSTDEGFIEKLTNLQTEVMKHPADSPEWNAIMLEAFKTLNSWTDQNDETL